MFAQVCCYLWFGLAGHSSLWSAKVSVLWFVLLFADLRHLGSENAPSTENCWISPRWQRNGERATRTEVWTSLRCLFQRGRATSTVKSSFRRLYPYNNFPSKRCVFFWVFFNTQKKGNWPIMLYSVEEKYPVAAACPYICPLLSAASLLSHPPASFLP